MTDIDDYLEHFGVKGMKWGTRRYNRAENFKAVGRGSDKGSKARAYTHVGPVDIVKGRGLKGAAARKGERMYARNERMRTGQASAIDRLKYYGTTKAQDIIPSSKSKRNTKAAVGASVAGALLIGYGMQKVTEKGSVYAFKRYAKSLDINDLPIL